MAEFLHRQLMESDIDRLSGYVTSYTLKRATNGVSLLDVYYNIPSSGGYWGIYFNQEYTSIYIGLISGLIDTTKITIGESENVVYGFIFNININDKSIKTFTYNKITKIMETKEVGKSVDGVIDGYFYYKINKSNPQIIEFYMKSGIMSKLVNNVEVETKMFDFDNTESINIQFGYMNYYNRMMINYDNTPGNPNIAYDISTLGGGATQEPEFEVKIIGNLGGTIEEFDISKLITVQGLQ